MNTIKQEPRGIQSPALRRKDAAQYLCVSLSTLDRKLKIPRVIMAGSIKYLIRDLDEYLMKNRVASYDA
jgi:hypothetical protein